MIYGLQRKVYLNGYQEDVFLPFAPMMDEYGSNALAESVCSCFSKITAIDSFRAALSNGDMDQAEAVTMLCALLTDHGLLYAQTREYGDPDSMRSFIVFGENQSELKERQLTYTPHIPASLAKAFHEQLREMKEFNLRQQYPSSPDQLKRLVHPSISYKSKLNMLEEIPMLETLYQQLYEDFQAYRDNDQIHPLQGKDETLKELSRHFIYFSFWDKNEKRRRPYYLDQPELILYLFRSPRYKDIPRLEKSGLGVILRAGLDFPIICSALPATEKLFNSILSVCEQGCDSFDMDFDRAAWENAWKLFACSVRCVQYDVRSLLTFPSLFTAYLLRDQDARSALDRWLDEKLSSPQAASVFSKFFTTAVNNKVSKKLYYPMIDRYKEVFINPKQQHTRDQYDAIEAVSTSFRWNKISVIPNTMTDTVPDRDTMSFNQFKKSVKDSDSNRLDQERSKDNINQDIHNVVTEWAFLQHICDQSARKLLDTAVILLERMQNEGL